MVGANNSIFPSGLAGNGQPRFVSLGGISGSSIEKRFELLLRAAGVTGYERNYIFAPPRKFEIDFAWPELKLGVEIQGGVWRKGGGAHTGGTAVERDSEKSCLAILNGWTVLPITEKMVPRAIEMLRQVSDRLLRAKSL